MLVASPEFLGKLRSALDDETRKRIDTELSLDLTAMTPKEIRARLVDRLQPAAKAH